MITQKYLLSLFQKSGMRLKMIKLNKQIVILMRLIKQNVVYCYRI